MRGPGSDLFDFIVDALVEFLKSNNLLEEATIDHPYHLGFTFSFPTRQRSLDRAELTKWTKGYTCDGVEGEDIGQLLKTAIKKRPELNVEVSYYKFIHLLHNKLTDWHHNIGKMNVQSQSYIFNSR